MKIGFYPHVKLTSKIIPPGTRIRVQNIIPHIKESVVGYSFDDLKDCKVVIFQARWLPDDILLAKQLHEKGIKLIFDTTDPHWDTENYDPTGIKRKAFDQLMPFINVVTLPTEKLKESFLNYRNDKDIEIVPDNIDLDKHKETRIHEDKVDSDYVICWYGCRSNLDSLELARADLEKLGKEFNLRLIAVYDQGYKDAEGKLLEVMPYRNLKLMRREWDDYITIRTILESDVVVNPRFTDWRQYKSKNKSNKAMALGVPVVEEDFYGIIKWLLKSKDIRTAIGKEGKEQVKQYDSKIIAKQIENLADSLVNKDRGMIKQKKKIAVVTAITHNWDTLTDPKFIDKDINYYAFLDKETEDRQKSNIWEILPIYYSHFKEPRMIAKTYKVLTHKFIDNDILVWIDGAVIIQDSIQEMIDQFLTGYDMALFKHRLRDCAMEEIVASAKNKFHAKGEPPCIWQNQLNKYKKECMPSHLGLYECTIILKRNNTKTQNFMNQWWSEITTNTATDQGAFMYIVWKNPKVKINTIEPGDSRNSKWMVHREGEGRHL